MRSQRGRRWSVEGDYGNDRMKRGTPQHPKVADLAARLNITRPHAVGLLEMLWHFTAQYAPAGDVGKFSDAAIADALGWDADPSALVAAMIASNWCNECGASRVVIHDWSEHAEDGVHTYLAVRGLTFADGTPPKTRKLNKQQRLQAAKRASARIAATNADASAPVAEKSAVAPCPLPLAPRHLPLALRKKSAGRLGIPRSLPPTFLLSLRCWCSLVSGTGQRRGASRPGMSAC